jgi:hypothetical protein
MGSEASAIDVSVSWPLAREERGAILKVDGQEPFDAWESPATDLNYA